MAPSCGDPQLSVASDPWGVIQWAWDGAQGPEEDRGLPGNPVRDSPSSQFAQNTVVLVPEPKICSRRDKTLGLERKGEQGFPKGRPVTRLHREQVQGRGASGPDLAPGFAQRTLAALGKGADQSSEIPTALTQAGHASTKSWGQEGCCEGKPRPHSLPVSSGAQPLPASCPRICCSSLLHFCSASCWSCRRAPRRP